MRGCRECRFLAKDAARDRPRAAYGLRPQSLGVSHPDASPCLAQESSSTKTLPSFMSKPKRRVRARTPRPGMAAAPARNGPLGVAATRGCPWSPIEGTLRGCSLASGQIGTFWRRRKDEAGSGGLARGLMPSRRGPAPLRRWTPSSLKKEHRGETLRVRQPQQGVTDAGRALGAISITSPMSAPSPKTREISLRSSASRAPSAQDAAGAARGAGGAISDRETRKRR